MSNCPNCNNLLGCSCQLRTASNGQTVCTACVTDYEKMINPNIEETVQHIHINLNEESSTQSS